MAPAQLMKKQDFSDRILNETAHLVAHTIKETIASAPEHPYKTVFSTSLYHRELLLASVIRNIYDYYLATREEVPTPITMLHFCVVEQTAIASFIQESAVQILEDEPYWTDTP